MNKAESVYAERLAALLLAGDIAAWMFEPLTFRLSHPDEGQPARYTPDFLVMDCDGTVYFDDVKASYRDRAGDVRLKAAAELFPWFRFRLCVRKKDGWSVTEV